MKCVILLLLLFSVVACALESDTPAVYAHYMAWFKSDTSWQHWRWQAHNPEIISTGKRQIACVHYPCIGPYSSSDTDLIACHLLQMKAASFDGIIINWYQKDDVVDSATSQWFRIVEKWRSAYSLDSAYFGIALMVDDEPYRSLRPENRVSAAAANINYILTTYYSGSHLSALRYKGLPLLFYFPKMSPEDSNKFVFSPTDWQSIKSLLSQPIYLVFHDPQPEYKDILNSCYPWIGVSNQDSTNWGEAYLRWYYEELRWLTSGSGWTNLGYRIGVAYPGFNDEGVYGWTNAPANTRIMIRTDRNGVETFDGTWNIVDSFNMARPEFQYKRMQIATFNDWNEGSEVEPSMETGIHYLKLCKERINKFKGQGNDDTTSLLIGQRYYIASKSGKVKSKCLEKSIDLFFNASYFLAYQALDTAGNSAAKNCDFPESNQQHFSIANNPPPSLRLTTSRINNYIIIRYNLPLSGKVKVEMFDIRGKLIQTFVNQNQSAGRYDIKWDYIGYRSGISFLRISHCNTLITIKLKLIN